MIEHDSLQDASDLANVDPRPRSHQLSWCDGTGLTASRRCCSARVVRRRPVRAEKGPRGRRAGAWGERISWESGKAVPRGPYDTQRWPGATDRAASRGRRLRRRRAGRAAEGVEHLCDDGGLGEDGADGELSAATNTSAKVHLEGSFQEGTPSETRARSVELAFEDSVPVGDRQDVRREVLGKAARRQRSGREEGDVEREGRATVPRFARRPRRRRCRRGDRRLFGGELLGLALAGALAPPAEARRGRATDGEARQRRENVRVDTSEVARWRPSVPASRRASSRARSPARASPSSRGRKRWRGAARGDARARRPVG